MQPEPARPAPKPKTSKSRALKAKAHGDRAEASVPVPSERSAAPGEATMDTPHEPAPHEPAPHEPAPHDSVPPHHAAPDVMSHADRPNLPHPAGVTPTDHGESQRSERSEGGERAEDGDGTEALAPVHAADHVERALKRERELPPPVITFGASVPTQADEYGLARDGGLMWLAYTEDMSMGHRRRKAAGELPGIEGQVHVHRLMPTEALKIRGRHNALNALAALALARAIGCPLAPMLHALRHYTGEPHRVQPVAVIDGVHYVDDSKGTNVGATVAALEGLGSEGRRLVVILGGDGKGQDFAPLVAPLAAYARGVVLIGRDGPRIGELLQEAAYAVHRAGSLPEAVEMAAGVARSGDVVLLSPACASLDMFRNYKHRAEVFVAAVKDLATEKGQVL
jgi:hypothetical protein